MLYPSDTMGHLGALSVVQSEFKSHVVGRLPGGVAATRHVSAFDQRPYFRFGSLECLLQLRERA